MSARHIGSAAWCVLWLAGGAGTLRAAEPSVDLSGYRSNAGVKVNRVGDELQIWWQCPEFRNNPGHLVLDLRPGQPLIRSMGVFPVASVQAADPVTFLLVGTREAPSGRPPGMSVFNVFFDAPAKRPFQSYRSKLDLKRVRVTTQGQRTMISLGDLAIGPFAGELQFTVYSGSSLVHVEAVVKTSEDRRAILYDAGLVLAAPGKMTFSWVDLEGKLREQPGDPEAPDSSIAVRNRVLIAHTNHLAVACFPPPHQFFFPRDQTDNLATAWIGKDHRGLESRFGFGIRQSEKGGGSYVPWYNAPPGTEQRLGVFYLLSAHGIDDARRETLRYTHLDQFPDVPGHHKFTTHWHMATAMAALQEIEKGGPRSSPDFLRMFKSMGIDIVHLAEFHGDGHPRDAGPVRLAEMKAMFDECRRLSDDHILFLPGEEANIALGDSEAGNQPGHWVYLFPRPVYWTMKRAPGQPFLEELSPYGAVYHVGSGSDWQRLLNEEHGLAWTSHPRIKGSSWTPDRFRHEDFYQSDRWLGAAWKAMPADLSHDRLGRRALDLLDDMANWGQRKYLPGEVDVFKLSASHELYGHMNVNYIELAGNRLPRFDEGWQPVLDALRSGRFFVSTGEVLIPTFRVGGQPSGSEVALVPGKRPKIQLELAWTFPMKFLEVISGDGSRVYRDRISLVDTGPFQRRAFTLEPDLTGRKWVRVEAWDVAANGAFTQPVWLVGAGQ